MKFTLTSKIHIEGSNDDLEEIYQGCIYENPKFHEAARMGYSTRKIPPYLYLAEEAGAGIVVPTGRLSDLLDHYPDAEIIDQRAAVPAEIPFTGQLRDYQDGFVSDAMQSQGGVMVAATGAGKTVSGIALSSRLQQRTLILVKSKDLARQWIDSIKQFTGLDAGMIGGGRNSEGDQFTIGLVQTLVKRDLSQLNYGLLIADECHNAPASQFYQVINSLSCRYKYGLSATPQRRDNMEFMIHAALGPIVAEIKPEELEGKVLPVQVDAVHFPFDGYTDSWGEFIEALINNEFRNDWIARLALEQDRPTIILTSQVRHAEILTKLAVEYGMEPLLIHGQLSAKLRSVRMSQAAESSLIIGTSQLLGEGLDWPHLEVLILATPMSANVDKANPAATRLIQSIGRCRRPYPGKEYATVVDIVDRCGFGMSAYYKRQRIYQLYGFWQMEAA